MKTPENLLFSTINTRSNNCQSGFLKKRGKSRFLEYFEARLVNFEPSARGATGLASSAEADHCRTAGPATNAFGRTPTASARTDAVRAGEPAVVHIFAISEISR